MLRIGFPTSTEAVSPAVAARSAHAARSGADPAGRRRRASTWRRWVWLPLVGTIGLGGLPCHWLTAPGSPVGTALAMPLEQAAAVRPQEVRVELTEWALSPNRVVVAAGRQVRFVVANRGDLPHALAVEGDGLYVETVAIGSAATTRLDVTFAAAGVYDLYCPLSTGQHRFLGQDGQLAAVVPVAGEIYPRTGPAAEEALTLAIVGPPVSLDSLPVPPPAEPAVAVEEPPTADSPAVEPAALAEGAHQSETPAGP